jgi:hypothetical protein
MNKINSTHILQTKLALQIFLQHLPEKNDTKRTIFTVTLKTRGFIKIIIYLHCHTSEAKLYKQICSTYP